jgi:sulfonate transport system substrate-binding protein
VAVVPGTVTQYLLVRALERAGLSLHDLSQVPLQGPEAVQALRRRDVDAVVLVDPLLAKALTDRDARVLVDGVGLLSGSNVLVATHDVLEEPDRVRAVADLLKRVKAALSWAQQHPKQWATVYASTNQLPADAALQAVHRASTTLVPIDAAAIASQQTQADTFARIGLLKHPLNVMQEFDQRFDGGLFGAR